MFAEKKIVSPHTNPSLGSERVALRGPVLHHKQPNVLVPLLVRGRGASEIGGGS